MQQFVFIFCIILAGFIAGQLINRTANQHNEAIRSICIFLALRITIPISITLAIWQLHIESWVLAFLPIIGGGFLLLCFAVAFIVAKVLKLPPKQMGVYAPAGGFTNIGAVGALTVLVFLGESGLALLPLFKVFEEVIYFAFFFPFAAKHSENKSILTRKWWNDPLIQMSTLAVTIGFSLNLLNIERPEEFFLISKYLVPIGTFALMITVGIAFNLGSIATQWRLGLLLALIKQLIMPIVLLIILIAFGFSEPYEGMILKTSVLLACMPMAFIIMLPAALFKLDQDLANACWFASTLLYILMLPFFPAILIYIDQLIT